MYVCIAVRRSRLIRLSRSLVYRCSRSRVYGDVETPMKGSFWLLVSVGIVLLTMMLRALVFVVADLSFHKMSMKTRMSALAATTLAATIAKMRSDGSAVPDATPLRPQQTGSAKSSSLTTNTCTMTTMMTDESTPKDKTVMTV